MASVAPPAGSETPAVAPPAPPVKPPEPGALGDRKVDPVPPGRDPSLKNKKPCDPVTPLKWVAVALAIAGFLLGSFGLSIFLGEASVVVTRLGPITSDLALYFTLGGYGGTFIISVLLGISALLSRSKKASGQAEASGNICCGGQKKVVTSLQSERAA